MVRLLDPALAALDLGRTDLSPEVLAATRDSLNRRRRQAAVRADPAGVEVTDTVAGPGRVAVRIYRGAPRPAPAVIYCHAGAFVLGNLDTDHRQCLELARRGRCTVVSVGYRLAPEHPYPAALDDAAIVLAWVTDSAAALGIDAARIAVAGSSAGAALAACLAQASADRWLPPVVLQLLHQPALDDRATPSKTRFDAAPGFDGAAAAQMWRHYLGAAGATADAVPARRGRLFGAPAAFISCSAIDPLRDEAISYAHRLRRAGVDAELQVFAGTCHGFDSLLPDWAVSQRLFVLQGRALRRCFYGSPS